MFEYFTGTMRTTKSHLWYFDYCGNVLDSWGEQQGDPVEMIVFCLSVHHLWGRTLNKHHQDECAVAYTDYGYIKAKLSVALEVPSDVKHILKEDNGLDINFNKTKILIKGISVADTHTAAHHMLKADLSLNHLSPLLSPSLLVVDCYLGLGVPICTDAFIQHFVKDKCQAIMEDVDKFDNLQDGFIHYQLICSSLPRDPDAVSQLAHTACEPKRAPQQHVHCWVPIAGWSYVGVGPVRGLRGGGRRGWCEEWDRRG